MYVDLGATFTFRVQSDGLVPAVMRNAITRVLKNCADRVVTLSIAEAKKKRSSEQNSYYYGVVLPCIQELFEMKGIDATKEETHILLKREIGHLTRMVEMPDGSHVEVVTSSTKISTQDWEDWMEKIRAWAARWGYYIPLPNEHVLGDNFQGRGLQQ
jgi:hypothetical protein